MSTCLERLIPSQVKSDLFAFGNCSSLLTTSLWVKDDLVSLFRKAADSSPDAIAVEKGDECLTYAELDRMADCVAHHISSLVQPGAIVCAHADRSIRWIVAIYGILKAGAVYCPFAEDLPTKLRDSNFEASGSNLFLASDSTSKASRPGSCAFTTSVEELLMLDSEGWIGAFAEPQSPAPGRNAYLCFTSGSTGLPKGVMCRHDSIVAFQTDLEVRLFSAPGRRVAQIMSPAFDGSLHEIFSTLSYGGTLVIGDAADPFAPLNTADSAVLTPSIAKVLDPRDFPLLHTVYLVGEPIPQNVNDRWATHKQLYNMYGPTETTCGATIKRLHPSQPVTIGSPNPSTRTYILGSRGNLLPPGIVGEIYIAGVQVSEGYVGRPTETAKAFVVDTICPGLGGRMYKTGDRGYWNGCGEIVCLGRKDRQVKLRGFRVDLDDLEVRILRAVPNATAVAVVQKQDFIVVVVQPGFLDTSTFLSKLTDVLPAFALPRCVTAVDQLPLTAAGKVDYAAIARLNHPPRTPIVQSFESPALNSMITLWRDILDLTPDVHISSDSNFIDLGGNSIQQMLLASRLATVLRRPVPLSLLAQYSTLGHLVRGLEALDSHVSWGGPLPDLDDRELSPIEKDWWRKYEAGLGCSAFNVNFASRLGEEVDLFKLTSAWNTVLARHRILSCRYTPRRRSGVSRTFSELPPRVERVNHIDIWQEINRSMDLRHGDLISVCISRSYMVIRISHIICDLTTLRILLREVSLVHHGSCLSQIKKTYTESVVMKDIAPPCNLDFWSEYLANVPREQYAFSNPQDRPSYGGTSEVCKITAKLFHEITAFTVKEKVTFHQMSLAAVAMALHHGADPHDIVLGAPYLNRKHDDDLDTVGLFLEPLPIRIRHPAALGSGGDVNTNSSVSQPNSFIHEVRVSSQAALAHAVPWNQLLDHLHITPDIPDHPLFSVMVTFHDDRYQNVPTVPGCKTLYAWSEGAKFKLMTEFLAVSEDTLLLRVEYDPKCYSKKKIELLQRLIVTALSLLILGMNYDEIKSQMREAAGGQRGDDYLEKTPVQGFFGMVLDEI